MSDLVFPKLNGRSWSRTRTPQFSTVINRDAGGSETRAAQYPYPLFKWSLQYNYLDDRADSAQDASPTDFDKIAGFYLSRTGSYDSFLFQDWRDYHAVGRQFGVGDGTTVAFPLGRFLGGNSDGFYLPIEFLDTDTGPLVVYDNGTPMTLGVGYSVSGTTVTLLGPAPDNTHTFTWDGYYLHRVRFVDDSQEYSNFMYKLWELKALDLVSAR